MTPTADALVLHYGAHLGEGFRAAREARKLSIQDVADVTRVRPQHIQALEALDIGSLPSRPFAIGYVRAYARLLGVDDEQAIARFKADAPELREPLRAPVGVHDDLKDPRLALILVGTAMVLGAIIVWNVAQRAMTEKGPPPPTAVVQTPSLEAAIPKGQPVTLGASLPAPVESTLPTPYLTPGLDGDDAPMIGDPTLPQYGKVAEMLPEAQINNMNAKLYGAPPEQSLIMLRARRPATLIVNSPLGAFFTRALSTGDIYRAPMRGDLTFDVSDPTAFDVYHSGQFMGQLPGLVTPIAKLGGAPQPAPAAGTIVLPAASAAPAAPAAASTAAQAPKPAAARPAPKPVTSVPRAPVAAAPL